MFAKSGTEMTRVLYMLVKYFAYLIVLRVKETLQMHTRAQR